MPQRMNTQNNEQTIQEKLPQHNFCVLFSFVAVTECLLRRTVFMCLSIVMIFQPVKCHALFGELSNVTFQMNHAKCYVRFTETK